MKTIEVEPKLNADQIGQQAAFSCPTGSDGGVYHHGLTKREYFAAVAVQGLLANPGFNDKTAQQIATWSVEQSDMLLEELTKEPNETNA